MKLIIFLFFLTSVNSVAKITANDCRIAPEFTLRDQSGEMKSLDRIRHSEPGKVIFISFFQTTCAPCIEEIRDLMHFRASNKNSRLVLVDSKEGRDETHKFLQKFNLQADHVLNDPNGRLDPLFKIDSVPRLIIVGTNGYILEDLSGPELFDLRKNKQFLKKMNEFTELRTCR